MDLDDYFQSHLMVLFSGFSCLYGNLIDIPLDFMQNRIEIFKQMIESDPDNAMVLFGLANEYLKTEDFQNAIATLEDYLAKADDEGAAYGMLAKAYEKIGNREKAREAYEKGIQVSNAHGHPTMAHDYQMTLDLDYAE